MKDQNFQVVLDPRTGQDLPQTYALDFKPSVYVSIENMNIRIIQLRKMNVIPLVNKPYVNEVTLNEKNLYQKYC